MIVGNLTHTTTYQLALNTRVLSRFTFTEATKLPKVSVYLDGQGAGTGSQVARVVVYNSLGNLVGYSDEVTVTDGQAAGWVDFSFLTAYPAGLPLEAGDYTMGVHGGANTNTIRVGADPLRWNRSVEPSLESTAAATWANASDANVTANSAGRSKTWAADGEQSFYAKLTKDANTTSRTFLVRTATGTSGMAATAGNTYAAALSARILDNLTNGVRLRLQWYNGATPLTPTDGTLSTGTDAIGASRVLTVSGAAPANTTNVSLQVQGTSTTSGDVLEIFLDKISVEEAASTSYFDGDDAGYLWLGAAGYSQSATGRSDSDTYSDGPSSTIGASPTAANRIAIYATVIPIFDPSALPDKDIAKMPFSDAVATFGSTAPDIATTIRATCGWHGTRFAEETGPYAIVKTDGILSGYVGERVLIRADDRVTYAYVYDERDIIEDISLTRRAFMDLAEPSTDELEVTITAMGAS